MKNKIIQNSIKLFLTVFILFVLGSHSGFAQNALYFDGTDDYVQSSQAGPTGSNPRTIEAWINMAQIVTSQIVIVDYGDLFNGQRFTLNLINGVPRIEIQGNGMNATSGITANTWNHIAVTFDNTATNKYKLYINGVLSGSGNLTVTINTASTNGITIGRRIDAAKYFIGKIDEVRVWNYARTQAQIQAAMNTELCHTSGLVSYYKFNQGVASSNNSGITTLYDNSGNSNNATLYNFSLNSFISNWVSGKALTAGSSTTSTISQTVCNTYTSPSGNYTWTNSGTYTDTIQNSTGCDSIITINLTVNQNSYDSIVELGCFSYISPSGNYIWNTTGNYIDTIPNAFGCDSILYIALVINSVDTSVVQNGFVITSNALGTYQWLDCDNGFSAISGAIYQSFTPAVDGNYAVEITENSCIDTSACYTVVGIGITEYLSEPNIKIYPNPVENYLFIELNKYSQEITIEISNIAGQKVFKQSIIKTDKTRLILSYLDKGFYIVKIQSAEQNAFFKFIKE